MADVTSQGVLSAVARKSVSIGGGSPNFVGTTGTYELTTTSDSAVTLTAGVTSGNMSVVLIMSSVDVASITDTGGNTYTEALEYTAILPNFRIWYSLTTTALSVADTITVNWTSPTYAVKVIECVEIENATTLDVTSTASGFTTNAVATATPTAPSVVVGAIGRNGTFTVSSGNNSTLLTSLTGTSSDYQSFYKNETATTSTSWGVTLASPAGITVALAVFK